MNFKPPPPPPFLALSLLFHSYILLFKGLFYGPWLCVSLQDLFLRSFKPPSSTGLGKELRRLTSRYLGILTLNC